MASSSRGMELSLSSNSRPTSTVTLTIRISEIELTGIEFTPTLRIGWINHEFSVFSHWKRLKKHVGKDGNIRGTIGWKSSLVKWVAKSTQMISLVLFQRVGETESPVALRTIPCKQLLAESTSQKHKFSKLPLMHMEGHVEGNITGWIRCEEPVEEIVQPNNWFGKVNDKVSETVSNSTPATQDSVDMSIDLTLEIPTVFYPFIKESDVFKDIFEKHIETLREYPYILKLFCDDMTRALNGVVVDGDCEGPGNLFLALGMVQESAAHIKKIIWHLPNNCDFDSLKFAAQEVVAQLGD